MIYVVFAAALLQGVALIVYPSAGNLFREQYSLSASQYGLLFAPMIGGAVLASSAAGAFTRRFGLRQLFLAGLGANALSMLLLGASWPPRSYLLLLWGEAALGLGFGAALTAMNTYMPRLAPGAAMLTALHAVVGIGTALPPLGLRAAMSLGAWWLLPLATFALLVLVTVAVSRSAKVSSSSTSSASGPLGPRVWSFAAAAALYGFCEALTADWGAVFLHEERGLSVDDAGLALSAFWAALTGGRILAALSARFLSDRVRYAALPLGIAAAYLFTRGVSGSAGALIAFGAVGLACSAFFPLTIALGSAAAPDRAEAAAGMLMAAFMSGAGVAAFGVGFVHDHAMLPLSTFFAAASVVALLLGALVLALVTPQLLRARA